ncbi:MAG: hypothetical protein RLZZ127_737 [Planctomycetota bacterium]
MILRALVLALLLAVAPAQEWWYVGDIGGQPSVSLRIVDAEGPDGRTSTSEMTMMVGRRIGPLSAAMTIRQTTATRFAADGRVVAVRIDEDQNGRRSVADLAVTREDGTEIAAGELRSGARASPVRVVLRPGERLADDRALQQAFAGLPTGATAAATGLALVSGRVVAARSLATVTGRDGRGADATVVIDLMPVPMAVRVDRDGLLERMVLDMGFIKVDLRRADGPVVLRPAEIDPAAIVRHRGPAPAGLDRQRYRLARPGLVAASPFQRPDGAEVAVVAAGDGPAPGPEWLRPEPNLESDAPELRAWVAAQRGAAGDGSPELAERLRLAVRAHITAKGLDQADAGALDTLKSRSGDCTEHAHLLCAALRAAGIPARVVVGVVYAADYGGWVGHAWVEGWAGRWLLLDAAYPGIPRTRYLALAESAGSDAGMGRVVAALAGLAGSPVEALP